MAKYIVQVPMPISFDVPKVNITNPNIPHTLELTEHEVRVLSQGVPNIKIVLVQEPIKELEIETPKKRVLLVESEPEIIEGSIEVLPSEETTTEPVFFEPSVEFVEQPITDPITDTVPVETLVEDVPNTNQVQSSSLSLKECIAHLQTLKTIEEVNAFVSKGETRTKLTDEVSKRSQELLK